MADWSMEIGALIGGTAMACVMMFVLRKRVRGAGAPRIPAALLTPDGRRAMAFAAVLGGCVVMTGFAAIGLLIVRGRPSLVFWLSLAAHAQILVGMTGLLALLVKRVVRVSRDGVEISDDAIRDGDAVKVVKEREGDCE